MSAYPSYTLPDYLRLIAGYLQQEYDLTHFMQVYFRHFKYDGTKYSEQDYTQLSRLFFALEDVCADPTLRDASEIDEPTLRIICQEVHDALSKA